MSSPLLERITPLIRRILEAPNIVPSEVSAKTVRKSLIEEYNISKDELTAEKEVVKTLILGIFQEIYPDEGTGEDGAEAAAADGTNDVAMNDATPVKKKHPQITAAASQASASVAPSSPGVPLVTEKQKKRKRNGAGDDMDADEEIARKLHQSFNTERSTRGSASSSGKKKRAAANEGGSKGKKSRVKSKAIIDDDDAEDGEDDGDSDAPKKKKKVKSSGDGTGAAKGGFSKPMILSAELADVIGQTTLSRPQVVKQLWDYIKGRELQNPTNKRVIMCDEKLQKVFKVSEIDMFQMNKVLSSHLRTAEE